MVNWFNLGSERGGQYKQIADSYYGLVIENFECEQSIYTAVEVGKILWQFFPSILVHHYPIPFYIKSWLFNFWFRFSCLSITYFITLI